MEMSKDETIEQAYGCIKSFLEREPEFAYQAGAYAALEALVKLAGGQTAAQTVQMTGDAQACFAKVLIDPPEPNDVFKRAEESHKRLVHQSDGLGPTAAEVNSAVRKEIVEMLECVGRKHLVEPAKEDDLIDVIGMLFAELSDVDGEAAAAPKLRERVKELEQLVSDTHGPMQKQAEQLNAKITRLNDELVSCATKLCKIGHLAHEHSTGPAVPDALWEIRAIAFAEKGTDL